MEKQRRFIGWRALGVALLLAVAPLATGQPTQPAPAPAPAPAAGAPAAPAGGPRVLRVFNRDIVTMRAAPLGMLPEERVQRARDTLRARMDAGGEMKVTYRATNVGYAVLVDDALTFMIMDDDIPPLGETKEAFVKGAVQRLQLALDEVREAHSLERMAKALGVALVATTVLALLLLLITKVRAGLTAFVVRHASRHAERLGVTGTVLLTQDRLWIVVRVMVTTLYWLLAALLVYEWLSTVLRQFPYTRAWGEVLQRWLLDQAGDGAEAVVLALPNLAVAIAIFLIARGLVRLLQPFFDRVESGQVVSGWLDRDTARPTRRLVSIGVWLFALVMAYPYLPGSGTDAFKGLSVLVGLMVSLGASSIVGQAVSGLILMYTRTVRTGEFIHVGEHEGTVIELGAFTTRIRTGMGEELSVPNSLFLANVTRNYSRAVKGQGFIVDATVTIGYDAPWRQVHAMLKEAARRTDGILADPSPHVFQTALSDFYVEYRLVAQAIPSDPRPRAEVMSQLHMHIQDVFNEYGVQIMSPHYLGDPAGAKIVPKERWFEAPAQREGGR